MRYLTTIAAASAILSDVALAAPSSTLKARQSTSFQLKITADSAAYDNAYLTPCHTGAGFEALCPAQGDSMQYIYTYNMTHQGPSSMVPKSTTSTGNLLYYIPASDVSSYPGYLQLDGDPNSNMAVAQFTPEATTLQLAFNKQGYMGLISYENGKVDPPVMHNATLVQNWHICNNTFLGYNYNSLTWQYGHGETTNPDCVPCKVAMVMSG